MKKLHKTQASLFKLLKDNIDNPLTIRELGAELKSVSPGAVHYHLTQLEKKGFLKRNPNNPKDYVLMDEPERNIVYLNKYGVAKCGPEGFILDGNIIERIPIATSLIKFPASEAFIVEAKGDSMEPKIFSGDIIIGKKQNHAEHGETIICTYEGEVLIKQFLKSEDGLFLNSLNSKYLPKLVSFENLRIEGIVKNTLQYH